MPRMDNGNIYFIALLNSACSPQYLKNIFLWYTQKIFGRGFKKEQRYPPKQENHLLSELVRLPFAKAQDVAYIGKFKERIVFFFFVAPYALHIGSDFFITV